MAVITLLLLVLRFITRHQVPKDLGVQREVKKTDPLEWGGDGSLDFLVGDI